MFIFRAKQQYMTIDKEHTCHNKCQMMIVIYTLKMKYKKPHCMANVVLALDVNIRRKYFSSSKLICYFLSVNIRVVETFNILVLCTVQMKMLFFDTFYELFYFLPYYIIAN